MRKRKREIRESGEVLAALRKLEELKIKVGIILLFEIKMNFADNDNKRTRYKCGYRYRYNWRGKCSNFEVNVSERERESGRAAHCGKRRVSQFKMHFMASCTRCRHTLQRR